VTVRVRVRVGVRVKLGLGLGFRTVGGQAISSRAAASELAEDLMLRHLLRVRVRVRG